MIRGIAESNSSARTARLVICGSIPIHAGKSARRRSLAASVARNGVLFAFIRKPLGGSITCGMESKGTYPSHAVALVSPGTIPDQSTPARRRGKRALYT